MEMKFLDPTGFDQQHYSSALCAGSFWYGAHWVFDVHPKPT